jgi:hypothetical protein
MKPFKVIHDWQSAYFNLPTQPPRREPPSDAVLEDREADRRREVRERDEERALVEHSRALRERELIEELKPLVERYGVKAVEIISTRQDPNFTLPAVLRAAGEEKDQWQ